MCRLEILGSGSNSLGLALLKHCTEHAAELLQTAHGGDLVTHIAGDSDIGQMLWNANKGAVVYLHKAIAKAAAGSSDAESTEAPLLEHFFASRTLKRMASAKWGDACRSCAQVLWNDALSQQVDDYVSSHAAKVLAALAQGHPDVSMDVRVRLQSVVKDVDTWLAKFTSNVGQKGKV